LFSGCVGIGTTSPTGQLHMCGSDPAFRIQSTVSGNMQLGQWDGTNNRIQSSGRDFLLTQTDACNMLFHTNSTERMRITSGGCVGINCTAPGAQLVVYGACNGDTTLHVQNGSVSGKISFSNNTANTIYGGGWWGYMGYSSATYHNFAQCVVAPSFAVPSSGCIFYCSGAGYNGIIKLWDSTNGNMVFQNASGGTGDMIFLPQGKVGIGTTSPNETLDVNGTIQVRGSSSGYATTQCVTQLDFYAGAARILSFGGNSTTCGCFKFYSAGQNNNGGSDVATISGGGVACFKGTICTGGHIIPTSNGSQDLGSSSLRWCTVYTSDLSLNNGIGNYTIVEGENDLFLYNNKQCKVYKFLLQEVCPEIAPAKRST